MPGRQLRRLVHPLSNARLWRASLTPREINADNNVRRFTIVLQAEPHIDAIRNLRVALKVLKRRHGLRVVTIREEP
jgi:hypothetical protein